MQNAFLEKRTICLISGTNLGSFELHFSAPAFLLFRWLPSLPVDVPTEQTDQGPGVAEAVLAAEASTPGIPGWLSGLILESRDQVPHRAPCLEAASPSACVSASLSLSLSLMNK